MHLFIVVNNYSNHCWIIIPVVIFIIFLYHLLCTLINSLLLSLNIHVLDILMALTISIPKMGQCQPGIWVTKKFIWLADSTSWINDDQLNFSTSMLDMNWLGLGVMHGLVWACILDHELGTVSESLNHHSCESIWVYLWNNMPLKHHSAFSIEIWIYASLWFVFKANLTRIVASRVF